MEAPFGPLVDPAWLARHLDEPGLRVVDFRWYLDGRSGREAHASGHIPGAVFVAMEDVSGESGPGRHPLPSAERFTIAARAAGISAGSRVVVYDDARGSVAARLWFLLRHFGHNAVAVLDGGLDAWTGPLETGAVRVPAGGFTAAEPAAGRVVDRDRVASRPAGTVLIDARAGERYRGEVEPVDARAGHIPGAVSLPWSANVGAGGRFLDPARLRAQFADAGLEPGGTAIVYCGSGVNASHHLLALELAGIEGTQLYEGSWSDWSRQPGLPVATGPEPGGSSS